MPSFVLRNAASVLTLDGPGGPRRGSAMSQLGVVTGGAVVVRDGTVAWVGPDAELSAEFADLDDVDVGGRTLMPALVDSHTHLVWGGDRKDELELRLAGADYEEIFAKGGGILSSVRQTRAASEDELFEQAMARVGRMMAAGTTTFEIKSGYGLELETELRQLRVVRRLRDAGVRCRATCLAAHAVPAEFRGSEEQRAAFVRRVNDEILPAVAKAGLADYVDVFCDRGAFTPEESRRVLQAAKALGFAIRIHANEFGHTGGALLAAEFEAASADHLLHLDDAERRALADAGVTATLLPGTSTVLGKSFADGRALVEAGVPVAVATDCNPGSCALENLGMVLALACYGCRLSVAEAVCGVTHNAAASLGLDAEVGSLRPGRRADVLVVDTADVRDIVYHGGSPFISAVYRDGHEIARAGAELRSS